MTMENALYSRLSGHAGLSALVGVRVYPLRLPQDTTLPAVTYTRVGTRRLRAMGSDPGLARARFQVAAWAATFAAGRDAGEQIRAALQRWRGTLEGVVVQDSFFETEVDVYEPDTETYQRTLNFEIIHEE